MMRAPYLDKIVMPFSYEASGLSDIGLVRENNEDVWAEIEELNFFVLADGMGGHQAGEVASREAVSHLLRLIRKRFATAKKKGLKDIAKLLRRALIQVNSIVYKIGKSEGELKGMGTTLCALFLSDEGAVLAHVGDSRIYRLRRGKLEQLTKDHSLFRELVELGQLSEHFASDFAYKNIITKAIGTEPKVDPTVMETDVRAKDLFLLCTDGLSDLLRVEEIKEVLARPHSADQIVEELIHAAKAKGGHDNITVVLVKVNEEKNLS